MMKQAVWKPEGVGLKRRVMGSRDGQTTGDEDQMSTQSREGAGGWGASYWERRMAQPDWLLP